MQFHLAKIDSDNKMTVIFYGDVMRTLRVVVFFDNVSCCC